MNRDDSLERDLGMPSARAGPNAVPRRRTTLLAFYRGRLSEAEGESVREHLAACAACVGVARDARAFLGRWEAAPEKARPVRPALAGRSRGPHRSRSSPGSGPRDNVRRLRRRDPCRRLTLPAPANPWRDLPVAAAEYRPPAPEDELVFRSDGEAPSAAFAAAMRPYERGDYAAAEAELSSFSRRIPATPRRASTGASRLLMLGRPDEATVAPGIRGRLFSAAGRGTVVPGPRAVEVGRDGSGAQRARCVGQRTRTAPSRGRGARRKGSPCPRRSVACSRSPSACPRVSRRRAKTSRAWCAMRRIWPTSKRSLPPRRSWRRPCERRSAWATRR